MTLYNSTMNFTTEGMHSPGSPVLALDTLSTVFKVDSGLLQNVLLPRRVIRVGRVIRRKLCRFSVFIFNVGMHVFLLFIEAVTRGMGHPHSDTEERIVQEVNNTSTLLNSHSLQA